MARIRPDNAVVAIRVKPGASRPAVRGQHDGPYGPALVVAVSEPAVDGRATEAAVRAVARALGLRPADVSLKVGATSRDKLLDIADPPADLANRVARPPRPRQRLVELSGSTRGHEQQPLGAPDLHRVYVIVGCRADALDGAVWHELHLIA